MTGGICSGRVIMICQCGRDSMVEFQLPKLTTRVRFPSPAPSSPRSLKPLTYLFQGGFRLLELLANSLGGRAAVGSARVYDAAQIQLLHDIIFEEL